MKQGATEQNDLEAALARVPEVEDYIGRHLRRVRQFTTLEPPARVLDVGAAQGVAMLAFQRAGFEAYGVEPWAPAIEVSHELERRTGTTLPIKPGHAEKLPYDDGFFRLVQSYSVMEHVDDPIECFREAYRVLEPGGSFFFSTSSVLSPRQVEIAGFPAFPWYPDPVRRFIMGAAAKYWPALVGNTTRPAIQWFRHNWVQDILRAIGFSRVVNRWELRRPDERSGLSRTAVEAAKRYDAVRFVGDVVESGMEYLAIR